MVVAGRGMDRKTRGLVENQERFIAKHLAHVRWSLWFGFRFSSKAKAKPRLHQRRRLQGSIGDQRRRDQPLDAGSRKSSDLLREVPVQSPAGVVGLHGELHLNKTGLFRLHSPTSSSTEKPFVKRGNAGASLAVPLVRNPATFPLASKDLER